MRQELHGVAVDGGPLGRQGAQQALQLRPVAFNPQADADAAEAGLVLVLARRGGLAAGDAQALRGGELAHALQHRVAELGGIRFWRVNELSQIGLQRLLGLRKALSAL